MADLDSVVAEIAEALDRARVGYMVIGGLAVAIWGTARATVDVDLAVAAGTAVRSYTSLRRRPLVPLFTRS